MASRDDTSRYDPTFGGTVRLPPKRKRRRVRKYDSIDGETRGFTFRAFGHRVVAWRQRKYRDWRIEIEQLHGGERRIQLDVHQASRKP